jgi:hypothetical protein
VPDAGAIFAGAKGSQLPTFETLAQWSGVAAVVFAMLAAVAGGINRWSSSKVNAAKDAALKHFQTDASATIATAREGAAEANRKAAEAAEGTATAAADAARANERAAKIELEAVEQRERAGKAERDLIEMQRRIEPRQIGKDSGTTLIAALRAARQKGTVDIQAVMGDAEGSAFAEQLDRILKAGGWTTTGVSYGMYTGGNPMGWGLIVNALLSVPAHALSLQKAFRTAGFRYTSSRSLRCQPMRCR